MTETVNPIVQIVSAFAATAHATPDSIAALYQKLSAGPSIPTAAPAVSETPSTPAIHDESALLAAREQLKGSTIFVSDQAIETTADEADRHAATVWPNATVEQRRKFMALIEKHEIKTDEHGKPIPKGNMNPSPADMTVSDPLSGKPFKMLRRHINMAYDLTKSEMIAMFDLPADHKITGPAYSELKRHGAARIGLGTEKRGTRGRSSKTTSKTKTKVSA